LSKAWSALLIRRKSSLDSEERWACDARLNQRVMRYHDTADAAAVAITNNDSRMTGSTL